MNKKQMKILVADDAMIIRELMRIFLETQHEVVTASNGREAVDLAKQSCPDLILLDLFMPEIGGDEVCRTLRQDIRFKDTPIVIVTSSGSDRMKEICLNAGANKVILKPVNKNALMVELKEYFISFQAVKAVVGGE